MVSKASDDLPDPETPVTTVRVLCGISKSMFLRLWTRAPRTTMDSVDIVKRPSARAQSASGTGEKLSIVACFRKLEPAGRGSQTHHADTEARRSFGFVIMRSRSRPRNLLFHRRQ